MLDQTAKVDPVALEKSISSATEALLGYRPGNVLKRAPRLRWIQARPSAGTT